MKSYEVTFKKEQTKRKRKHHKGESDYRTATVIAMSPVIAGQMAVDYLKDHLRGFEVEEIRLDNDLVIL